MTIIFDLAEMSLEQQQPCVDFFNDRPDDPLMGRMIRRSEMEKHWWTLLKHCEESGVKYINLSGYDEPIWCLLYLLNTQQLPFAMEEFVISIPGAEGKIVGYEDGADIEFNPPILSPFRKDILRWLNLE